MLDENDSFLFLKVGEYMKKYQQFALLSMILVLFFIGTACGKDTKKTSDGYAKKVALLDMKAPASLEGLETVSISWNDEVPSDILFVVVDGSKHYDSDKQKYLRSLVEKKHSVMFFGEDIQLDDVASPLRVPNEDIQLQSTIDTVTPLMGYGYNPKEKQNMFWFLSVGKSSFFSLDKEKTTLKKWQLSGDFMNGYIQDLGKKK